MAIPNCSRTILEDENIMSEKEGAADACSRHKSAQLRELTKNATNLNFVIRSGEEYILTSSGLSVLDLEIMSTLLIEEEWSITDLAHAVRVNVSTVSRQVTKLVDSRLASRRRPRSDRRVVLIHLTEPGRRLATELGQRVGEFEQFLFGGISKEEMETFEAVIEKMQENYDHFVQGQACET